MKVRLQTKITSDGRSIGSLSLGNAYEVIGIEANEYRILDDNGEPILFDPSCFEVSDPEEPSFWINALGDGGERYAYPPGWGVKGFFEDWHDGSKLVRDLFSIQLSHWYPNVSQGGK